MLVRHRIALGGLILCLAAGAACNTDYEIALSKGYELHRFYPGSGFALVDSKRENSNVVVFPAVDRYACAEKWIAGHVSPAGPGADGETPEVSGYFLLETDTGRVAKGLGWGQLRQRLRDRSVEASRPESVLKEPTRWMAWKGSRC